MAAADRRAFVAVDLRFGFFHRPAFGGDDYHSRARAERERADPRPKISPAQIEIIRR